PCCALVHIHPLLLEIAWQNIDLAAGRIAISSTKLFQRRHSAIVVAVQALLLGKNLLARGVFELVDVAFVDVELHRDHSRFVGGLHQQGDPFPLGPPILESSARKAGYPFWQAVTGVFSDTLILIPSGQPGVEERSDDAAADLSRDAVHDVEQAVEKWQGILSQEQPFLANHSAPTSHPQDRNLVVKIATAAIPSIMCAVASRQRGVETHNAGGLPLVHPSLQRLCIPNAEPAEIEDFKCPAAPRAQAANALERADVVVRGRSYERPYADLDRIGGFLIVESLEQVL